MAYVTKEQFYTLMTYEPHTTSKDLVDVWPNFVSSLGSMWWGYVSQGAVRNYLSKPEVPQGAIVASGCFSESLRGTSKGVPGGVCSLTMKRPGGTFTYHVQMQGGKYSCEGATSIAFTDPLQQVKEVCRTLNGGLIDGPTDEWLREESRFTVDNVIEFVQDARRLSLGLVEDTKVFVGIRETLREQQTRDGSLVGYAALFVQPDTQPGYLFSIMSNPR
ncbi:hypothetical protein F2P81_005004 [Scophthalmus maximus]|uniref:Uncharacterized protein n=1 Tax=Scophthalmus maximus TaxID=52904 RepID=A0A6A4TB14_SCOMX|nr:hypothetical protein F2P81_005004 [Scophthalmus maximus]